MNNEKDEPIKVEISGTSEQLEDALSRRYITINGNVYAKKEHIGTMMQEFVNDLIAKGKLIEPSTHTADVPTDEEIEDYCKARYNWKTKEINSIESGIYAAKWMRDLMRERAKREAVEFREWCEREGWHIYNEKHVPMVWHPNEEGTMLTTPELYDAFLASRKEGNR